MARRTLKLVIFRNIGELLTLAGAAAKSSRGTQDEDLSIVAKAAIVSFNGRVIWVGPERRLPKDFVEVRAAKSRGERISRQSVDCEGRAVMPALVDCHTHLIFAGDRGAEFDMRVRGLSYQEIAARGGGILTTVRATRKASVEALRELGQSRADRHLRQGVTTVEVKSGYGLNTVSELKMLRAAGELRGPRVVRTYLGAHAVAPEFKSAADYLDHCRRVDLPKVKREGLACRVDVFVENGYFPVEIAEPFLREAKTQGFDLAIHADQLTLGGGTDLAVRLGARSADHILRIGAAEIERLAASEVTGVLLPGADLYMNCPYPPARALLDQGARVALATDFNPGTCPSLDVALMGVLARVQMRMTLAEVIVAFTLGGAHALGFGHDLGAIVPGRLCDIVVLEDDWRGLFSQVGYMPVRSVWKEATHVS